MRLQHRTAMAQSLARCRDLELKSQTVFAHLLRQCLDDQHSSFWQYEQMLAQALAELARGLFELFLAARQEHLWRTTPAGPQGYRLVAANALRSLKTAYGRITYQRSYWIPEHGGPGWHPLDAELGLTTDGFSPWVIQFATMLTTQLSYAAARQVFRHAWNWAPSTEAIEQLVLGLGQQASSFMEQSPVAAEEGEVLVIETDGKCTPTATAAELEKRRGPRRRQACNCSCQRHRGRCRRKSAEPRKRRKKGDKSKNGREVMLVVMYTLRRDAEGRLHGPHNKKVWASYAGRPAAAAWARQQATKRGFPPGTDKTIQILMDGAQGLKHNFQAQFPQAIFTLDVCHVTEKLWDAGQRFFPEGSPELRAWVQDQEQLLYAGRVQDLIARLRMRREQVSRTGPGTKGQRSVLDTLVKYLEARMEMMRYDQWQQQDLVLASGQVEGAARHVVGQRLDGSGMRWIPGRAEPLLHLRCIVLNHDWETFIDQTYRNYHQQLLAHAGVQIRTNTPVPLKLAA